MHLPRLLVLAFALPVVLTASTLAQVAWNRSTSRGPIALTEREIQVRQASGESSARRGWIAWQYRADDRDWIGREALTALGFDLSVDPASPDAPRHYGRMLAKEAWVALELGGPAFEALPKEARAHGSRLVPVDVSASPQTLAQRYPDAGRHLITAAVVRVFRQDPPDAPPYVAATVDSLRPRALYIPRELAPVADGRHYSLSVVYGRRFEPWVAAASR